MNIRRLVLGACLIATATACAGAQGNQHASPEQTHFSSEDVTLKNQVPVPNNVLALLKKEKLVRDALENENVPHDNLSPSWFSASTVHLSSRPVADLVVRAERPLAGANTDHFWVFRNIGARYELVLDAPAHDLEIRTHRSNGYRDIEMSAETASKFHSMLFRFNGKRYVVQREKTEPIK